MVCANGHHTGIPEKAVLAILDHPPAEAVLVVAGQIAIKLRIACGSIERATKVAHYLGVGIHRRKRAPVGLLPDAQAKAGCLDHHDDGTAASITYTV